MSAIFVLFQLFPLTGRLLGLKLILYGTKDDPLESNSHVDRSTKRIESVKISLSQKDQKGKCKNILGRIWR